ncbi:MAG: FixH family protein [Rhizobiaceae bacterium]
MKWIATLLALVTSGVPATACVKDALRLTTKQAVPVEIFARLEPITVSQPFDLTLTLCDAPPGGIGRIEVDAWMPKHKHGMNYSPSVQQAAAGHYDVSNMVFHMPGLWQLRVSLAVEDQRSTHLLDITVK